MKHDAAHSPAVAVYVTGGSWSQHDPDATSEKSGLLFRTAGVVDPFRIASETPGRWRAYLHATYRTHADVQRVFEVSERTARKWWEGEMGCRAQHLIVALRTDPDNAWQMMIGGGEGTR